MRPQYLPSFFISPTSFLPPLLCQSLPPCSINCSSLSQCCSGLFGRSFTPPLTGWTAALNTLPVMWFWWSSAFHSFWDPACERDGVSPGSEERHTVWVCVWVRALQPLNSYVWLPGADTAAWRYLWTAVVIMCWMINRVGHSVIDTRAEIELSLAKADHSPSFRPHSPSLSL